MEYNDSLRYYFSCSIGPQMYPIYSTYRTVMISSFIVDAFLFVTIIPTNLLIFLVIVKNKELQTPPNLCLVSISISDFAVGLFNIPLFTSNFLLGLNRRHNCELYITMYAVMHYLFIVSNFMVIMIILDRYIAILYPFKYHTSDKVGRYTIAISIIWISAFCFILFVMLTRNLSVLTIMETGAFFCGFVFLFISQIRIRNKLKIVKRKIHQTRVIDSCTTTDNNKSLNNHNNRNVSRKHRNPTKTRREDLLFFSIVSSNFLCYIPFAVCVLNWTLVGDTDWVQTLNTWAFTTATAKSLLNPLIYFYSMKKMRQGLKKLCQRKHIKVDRLQTQYNKTDNTASYNISSVMFQMTPKN